MKPKKLDHTCPYCGVYLNNTTHSARSYCGSPECGRLIRNWDGVMMYVGILLLNLDCVTR